MHSLLQRLVPTAFALVTGASLSGVASCTTSTQQKVVNVGTTVLDAGSAVCQAIASVPGMPDAVKVICEYVDKADGLSKIFVATIPRTQARAMGMVLPCAPAPVAPSASVSTGLAPLPPALAASSSSK